MHQDQVPYHLRMGDLFTTLMCDCYSLDDGASTISIPACCAKMDDVFESIQDLILMLQTLRFWISSALPEGLIEYVVFNDKTNPLIVVHLRSFVNELPQLLPLLDVLDCHTTEGRMRRAVELGHLPILKHLHALRQVQLQQRLETHCELPLTNRLGLPIHPIMRVFQRVAPDLCAVAAHHGQFDCLHFLHENDYEWDPSTCLTALNGRNERCLHYALQEGCPAPMLCSDYCTRIVKESFYDCLVLAVQRGCVIDAGTCDAAAGNVKILKFLHEKDCPRTAACAAAAAANGNLESLEFIHNSGGPWDKSCTAAAAAAAGDHLEALQFAHSNGCPWDHSCTNAAAEAGSLRCLEYAVREGCSLDAAVLVRAVRKGSITCVRYLRSLGLPWTEAIASAAADERNPHHHANGFACLKYVIECGCPHQPSAFRVYQARCRSAVH